MADKSLFGKAPEPNCPPGKEFVFRTREGKEVGKARNVSEFVSLLRTAPLESVAFHANGGHFAPWLEFMGQRVIAARIKGVKGSGESVRRALIAVFG